MSKEIKEIKKDSKVNISYLEFINNLVNSKLEISNKNLEVIEKKYSEIVNLKFSNLKRVSNRNNRKEVIEKRNKYLLEVLKLDNNKYLEVDKKVNNLVSIKESKYI